MFKALLYAALIALIYVSIFSKRGWFDYQRMIEMNQDLLSKTESVKKQKDLLEHQIRALQVDPEEQERIVRHVLGYVRSGETVIEFQ